MATFKKCTALAVILIAFLTSCTTEKFYPTEEIYLYPDSFTKDYTVYTDKKKTNHWEVGKDDASGDYFYCEIKEDALTADVYELGAMQAFLLMNNGNLTPLPFNDYWYDGYYNNYHWTEQVTVEFRPGYITFILKYSDHEVVNEPSYIDYTFRVRFVW